MDNPRAVSNYEICNLHQNFFFYNLKQRQTQIQQQTKTIIQWLTTINKSLKYHLIAKPAILKKSIKKNYAIYDTKLTMNIILN